MNVSSADIFNGLGLGMNEIDSFNKTLNEMLSVWNLPIEQQLQHQQTQNNNNSNNNNNNINAINNALDNILNTTSKGIQLPRFNLNSSSSGFLTKDILSNSNETLYINNSNNNINNNISNSSNNNNNNNIYNQQQTQQQNNKPVLNNSSLIKTINEISNEQKSYQPFEITPIKATSSSSTPTSNFLTEFGVLNSQFILDSNKIEELRVDTSVLDPILSLPYGNQINVSKKDNGLESGPVRSNEVSKQLLEQQLQLQAHQAGTAGLSNSTFALNKEELNTFTSSEMNTYVKQANMVKDLSQFEKKELKRQKRLIKNRESAHLSRQRKRLRLTELEHKVEELSSNSLNINKNLSSLENENLILKAEVNQLFEVINDSPVLSALFYKIASLSSNNNTGNQEKTTVGCY